MIIKNKTNLGIIFLLSIILFYYIWTALPESYNFGPKGIAGNYYNLLTDAFLKGQLYLDLKPRKRLLTLEDPYDPVQNYPDALLDAAFYQGKYYLYYGPVPVISLYLPYKVLTRTSLPNNWAFLVFVFGSLIWAVLLLKHLHEKYFNEIPSWMLLLVITVLGFANFAPYMLRLTSHYQVAIACAQFFLMGGIYFLCRVIEDLKLNLFFLIFGSLFLGLSIGSRLNLVFGCVAILLIVIWSNRKRESFGKGFLLGLLLPFSLCLFLLAVYNYLRFNNPFEFGVSYQLCVINFRKTPLFGVENIIPNVYNYIFHRPIVSIHFPFIYLKQSPHFLPKLTYLLHERNIVGIFPLVPFILSIFLAPFVSFLSVGLSLNFEKTFKLKKFPVHEFLIIFLPAILILGFLLLLAFTSIRYIADFITLLILSSSIVWFYFDLKLAIRPYSRLLLRMITVMFALVSIINGAALGITGCEFGPGLRGQSPEEFRKLESFFSPVSKVLSCLKKENRLSSPIEK